MYWLIGIGIFLAVCMWNEKHPKSGGGSDSGPDHGGGWDGS